MLAKTTKITSIVSLIYYENADTQFFVDLNSSTRNVSR